MTRLNRSETVTFRLDPRMNYLTELAARAQRRTKSSFVEWAIQKALKSLPLGEWLPIESAPRDKMVLVWSEGRAWTAWWHTEGDEPRWAIDYEEAIEPPTHWMPLPPPPRSEYDDEISVRLADSWDKGYERCVTLPSGSTVRFNPKAIE